MKNHHRWWWYMDIYIYMVSKRLKYLKFTWCWLDGDFFRHVPFLGGRLSYSFEILRRRWSVDADLMVIFTVIWWDIHGISSGILIGLLKQGWNNFRPSSSKLIKKTIDNHGSWGFIYKMVGVPWWNPYLFVSLLGFYTPGTGHPSKTYHSRHSSEICSQPRVVHLMERSLGDCSAIIWWPEGITNELPWCFFAIMVINGD